MQSLELVSIALEGRVSSAGQSIVLSAAAKSCSSLDMESDGTAEIEFTVAGVFGVSECSLIVRGILREA